MQSEEVHSQLQTIVNYLVVPLNSNAIGWQTDDVIFLVGFDFRGLTLKSSNPIGWQTWDMLLMLLLLHKIKEIM